MQIFNAILLVATLSSISFAMLMSSIRCYEGREKSDYMMVNEEGELIDLKEHDLKKTQWNKQ